jgi:hypothetical protein
MMKKRFKPIMKILAVIITVELLTILTLRSLISYEYAKLTRHPWKSGETTVTLSQDGTLKVSGVGRMKDYSYDVDFEEWAFDVTFRPRPESDYDIKSRCCYGYEEMQDGIWSYNGDSNPIFLMKPGYYYILLIRSPWAYKKKDAVSAVVIGDSVSHIGAAAFYGFRNLTSVTIGGGVTSIGDTAFTYCENLTTVTIPNGVKSIGRRAFAGCENLTSIAIPNSVTSIGEFAFNGCYNLKSITIGDSVKTIDNYAFTYSRLTSITIPNGVISIGQSAFAASELTSVTIPDNVEFVDAGAFWGCCDLERVTIGNGVAYIGPGAFRCCPKLRSIFFRNPKPPEIDGSFSNSDSVCFYVPAGSINAYRNAQKEAWGDKYKVKCIKSI